MRLVVWCGLPDAMEAFRQGFDDGGDVSTNVMEKTAQFRVHYFHYDRIGGGGLSNPAQEMMIPGRQKRSEG